jgi:hypothetical protein
MSYNQQQQQHQRVHSSGNYSSKIPQLKSFKSKVEEAILKSSEPIRINETQQISANKERGIWANRCEVCTWKGDIPIQQYPINDDPCPEIIHKKSCKRLEYQQEIAIRYLKPPAPAQPGEIIIKHEANKPTAPAPPIVIRQQPPRPCTPEPLVIREAPPPQPPCIGQKVITIAGKQLPAPPRKVIVERMAPMPVKPQPVIIERWMPYVEQKRRVIYQQPPPDPVICKPKNIIVQWEQPDVCVKKDIKHLGVVCANPCEYIQKYGSSLKRSCELPQFVKDIQPSCGIELAANKRYNPCPVFELCGDVCALNKVDLDKEGLSQYKNQVRDKCATGCPVTPPPPTTSPPCLSNKNNNADQQSCYSMSRKSACSQATFRASNEISSSSPVVYTSRATLRQSNLSALAKYHNYGSGSVQSSSQYTTGSGSTGSSSSTTTTTSAASSSSSSSSQYNTIGSGVVTDLGYASGNVYGTGSASVKYSSGYGSNGYEYGSTGSLNNATVGGGAATAAAGGTTLNGGSSSFGSSLIYGSGLGTFSLSEGGSYTPLIF